MRSAAKQKQTPIELSRVIDFGRDVCGDLAAAESREWLVTNGIGGFASGTIAGLLTRRYHGLLIASLHPPVDRILLVSKVEEVVTYCDETFSLGANRWRDGTLAPQGFHHIERFRLEGTTAVWTYSCADALIEKRVWMQDGENTTFVRYELIGGRTPLSLAVDAFVNYRDYHGATHAGDWRMDVRAVDGGVSVEAFTGAQRIHLSCENAGIETRHDWYRNYDLAAERERGLDDHEDHLRAATFHAALETGKPVTLVFSTRRDSGRSSDQALRQRRAAELACVKPWSGAPEWIRQLALAASQFIVARPHEGDTAGRTVLAGYPWFTDWGRDTMIALPGLALVTKQYDTARNILKTFARFVDRGMLPNRFIDGGELEYNTVDAALWFIEAVRRYADATKDKEFVAEVFPALEAIVEAYERGTRFNIHMDPADGLIAQGEPGVQLTWMDAKVGSWVVTPRIGKPVEVNALWVNALQWMATFSDAYIPLHERAATGFKRFFNAELGYCFDVLDGPDGDDPAFRPNQIFAVSLPLKVLTAKQQRAVVDACARDLLTSYGLRSLSPADPAYRGRCSGPPQERDAAYHQGTVWGWLLGPFAIAHHRVYKDAATALSFLEPMAGQLQSYGVGSLGEIFDGDPPFTPRGCIAQAWTVAEVLRAWTELTSRPPRL